MKLVTRKNISKVLETLQSCTHLSLDTETTGLRPFHGDKLFAIIIANADEEYYFNFQNYPSLPADMTLTQSQIETLQESLFNRGSILWYIHRAAFDLPILLQSGLRLHGTIHCTKVGARIQYNEHIDYSLAGCGLRIGVPKSTAVEEYIKEHKVYTIKEIDGKKKKHPHYDKVPFETMYAYGAQDARVCFDLGESQREEIKDWPVYKNELALQKVLFGIQERGCLIDTQYCRDAYIHFTSEMILSSNRFKELTGREFMTSGKMFGEVFASDRLSWVYTDKGNPSFVDEALVKFEHPAAKEVIRYKKAKAKINFFQSFLRYADENNVVHTELQSYGTKTGRFSSSNPNMQNLEKATEQALAEDFVVRRAIVPRSGYFFAMLDFDQIEYRMMLDYAGADDLIDKVLGGLDVHSAMAEIACVTRSEAKTVNFLTLYGGGIKLLAENLGVTEKKAKEIQDSIFNAAPEVRKFMKDVSSRAKTRGYIQNWLGRRCYFPKKSKTYKAPNSLIQGGGGDVAKVAMVEIDAFLRPHKSNLLLNIHDEIVLEMAIGEQHLLPVIKDIMENMYPHKKLPLTCGIEWSPSSLADKRPYTGVDCISGEEARDSIQGANHASTEGAPEGLDP